MSKKLVDMEEKYYQYTTIDEYTFPNETIKIEKTEWEIQRISRIVEDKCRKKYIKHYIY